MKYLLRFWSEWSVEQRRHLRGGREALPQEEAHDHHRPSQEVQVGLISHQKGFVFYTNF